jgi:hypothetical protein
VALGRNQDRHREALVADHPPHRVAAEPAGSWQLVAEQETFAFYRYSPQKGKDGRGGPSFLDSRYVLLLIPGQAGFVQFAIRYPNVILKA